MGFMKITKKISVWIIFIILLASLLYYFPLQRYLAKQMFARYIELQGVSPTDIESQSIYKDYKQDGYYIAVRYYSDPNHIYKYHYFLLDRRKAGTQYNVMYCDVYNLSNHYLDNPMDAVYKPLK